MVMEDKVDRLEQTVLDAIKDFKSEQEKSELRIRKEIADVWKEMADGKFDILKWVIGANVALWITSILANIYTG